MQTLLRHKAIGLAPLVILCASCALFPTNYGGAPLEGLVIDAKTKKPLEGVIVVQYWRLLRPTVVGHSNFAGVLHLQEAITDTQGRYIFKRWESMPAPAGTFIDSNSPEMSFFKLGYVPIGKGNYLPESFGAHERSNMLRSDWSGKTIELEPAEMPLKDYASRLAIHRTGLYEAIYRGEGCQWPRIPRTVAALHKEKRRLELAGVSSSLVYVEQLPSQDRCGDARTVLKEYLQ